MPANEILDSALPPVPQALDAGSAVIVNLPGADAVYAGLSLAQRGFQPVPLFNGTSGPSPVIDVSPILWALGGGAERLKRTSFAADARPAFLLDSRRGGGLNAISSGMYDNRWVALPQDFPSGALLVSRGISTATLLQRESLSITADLAHVLRRWQDYGMEIRVIDIATGQTQFAVNVPRPSYFRMGWYAALALMGLRRSNVGGFGSIVPDPSRGGFYG
jgi:hypothetical protein